MWPSITLVVICLISNKLPRVNSLKCYICVSDTATWCPANNAIDCPASSRYCGKTYADTGKAKVAARTCLPTTGGLPIGCTEKSVGGITAESCFCTTDLCNTGSTYYKISWISLFATVLLLIIKNC